MGPTSRRTPARNARSSSARRCSSAGFHSQRGIYAGKASVVQLVAHVQGQLQVQTVGIGIAHGSADAGELVARRWPGQGATDSRRQRSVCRRQGGFDRGRCAGHAGDYPLSRPANGDDRRCTTARVDRLRPRLSAARKRDVDGGSGGGAVDLHRVAERPASAPGRVRCCPDWRPASSTNRDR